MPRFKLPLLRVVIAGVLLALTPAVARPGPRPAMAAARATQTDPVLQQIDQLVITYLPRVITWQDNYRAGKGKFFQALRSHTTCPADGRDTTPDRLDHGPTDQAEKLRDLWNGASFANRVPFCFSADIYDGPLGQGYAITLSLERNGQIWQRVVKVGPEAWRDQGWAPRNPMP